MTTYIIALLVLAGFGVLMNAIVVAVAAHYLWSVRKESKRDQAVVKYIRAGDPRSALRALSGDPRVLGR